MMTRTETVPPHEMQDTPQRWTPRAAAASPGGRRCGGPVSRAWIVGLLLLGLGQYALAQDTPGGSVPMEAEAAQQAYDATIIHFNTHIHDFPSWQAFATTVLAQVPPGTPGTCYTVSGGRVDVTRESLPTTDPPDGWQKTPGKGWQQHIPGRRYIEYRFNAAAQVMVWVEGVKPRWFFAHVKKMCTVPLGTTPTRGPTGAIERPERQRVTGAERLHAGRFHRVGD